MRMLQWKQVMQLLFEAYRVEIEVRPDDCVAKCEFLQKDESEAQEHDGQNTRAVKNAVCNKESCIHCGNRERHV